MNFKKKFELSEKERKRITDEKDQFKMLLDNIQKNLDVETREKERFKIELENCKKERDKVNPTVFLDIRIQLA